MHVRRDCLVRWLKPGVRKHYEHEMFPSYSIAARCTVLCAFDAQGAHAFRSFQALFNPHGSVVKVFVVPMDLTHLPPNSETFLRQRTVFIPQGASDSEASCTKYLRYLIHLRFAISKYPFCFSNQQLSQIHQLKVGLHIPSQRYPRDRVSQKRPRCCGNQQQDALRTAVHSASAQRTSFLIKDMKASL